MKEWGRDASSLQQMDRNTGEFVSKSGLKWLLAGVQ
jgi:hypothetical protein